jgi:hypothetical protein
MLDFVWLLGCLLASALAVEQPSQLATKPLYLHWCHPAYYLPQETVQPARILSTRIVPGRDIDITLDDGSQSLKGRIDVRDGKYHAELDAHFASSTGSFEGDIQLRQRFKPSGYVFGSVVWGTYFVLSTEPNCEEFLKPEK